MLTDIQGVAPQSKQGVQVRGLLPEYGAKQNSGGDSGILSYNGVDMGESRQTKTEDQVCSGIH
ncbi:hypothetical protein D3C73_1468540 [compost metagenome]